MRFSLTLVIASAYICALGNAANIVQRDGSLPECALTCLATLIPEHCGSMANTTCICTDTGLSTVLNPCVMSACSVTEALSVAKYSADSCGVISDTSRQYEQIRFYCILVPIATLFIIGRVFSRVKFDVGMGMDDWLIIAAHIAYLIDMVAGLIIATSGFGQHTYYLTVDQVTQALKFFYVAELFYLLAITLTKLSLLFFFRRIFPNPMIRAATVIIGVFVISSNFAVIMALCLQCLPVSGNWTNWMYKTPPVKCIDSYAVIFVAAGMSIVQDLIILFLPIPVLWKLNLSWSKKINLLAMFSVGSFVVICSLLRLPSLLKMTGTSDPSFDQAPVATWTDLEIGVGIICACLPACRSLIGYIFPNMRMTLGNSSNNNGSRSNAAEYPHRYPLNRSNNNRGSIGGGGLGGKMRQSTFDRTFIELTHRSGSEEELERDDNHHHLSAQGEERSSMNSQESKLPFVKILEPRDGKNIGVRTQIDSFGAENLGLPPKGRGGITKTVEVHMTTNE